MFEGCVDKGSKEYKELCSRFNTSLSHMEIIFHSWWKTHDDGSWPSDDFIKGKLYGERVEMSDRSIYVAEENGYFNSKEFSDRKEAESYYRRLAGLYPKRAIGSYTNSGGKVVIVLSKPIISSDSKYKNLKKPAIGGAIEIGGNIQAITGVQKRTDKEFLVSTENGFISVNIIEGGRFTDRAGNELIITGAVPYYSEYESTTNETLTTLAKEVSTKGTTQQYGVIIDPDLKSNHSKWQADNPNGIVAYRVNFNRYNTPEEANAGRIGNPFSENTRGATTVEQFFTWLVTGENFDNAKATEEYRQAIINKILSTPADAKILYYKELGRPSHATVLGYLVNHKELLKSNSYDTKTSKSKPSRNTSTVTKIISGGQTGVDTIGLQVARSLGIETGGTAPKGFLREQGIDSEDISSYGLIEISDEQQADYTRRKGKRDPYTGRTELNVKDSDGTVYFSTAEDSAGRIATKRAADEFGKPFIENPTAEELRDWMDRNNIKTLNVAGNRGSKLSNGKEIVSIIEQALTAQPTESQEEINLVKNNLRKLESLIKSLPKIDTSYFISMDEVIDFIESLSGYNARLGQLSKYLRKLKQEGKSLNKAEYDATISLLKDVGTQLKDYIDLLNRLSNGEIITLKDYSKEPIKPELEDYYVDTSIEDSIKRGIKVKEVKGGKVTFTRRTGFTSEGAVYKGEYTVSEEEFRRITGGLGSDFRYQNFYGFADVSSTFYFTEDGKQLYSMEVSIPNREYRGKGHGLEIYEAVIEELASRGAYLTPGLVVPTNHVWEALERRGRVKEVKLSNGQVAIIALPKTPINNKQNKEEYGQRRIYTESISAAIRKGWKEIGRSTKESSSKGLQGQDRDQGRNSTRSGRLLDDVVAEANDSLDKELSSRGIKATKQKIRVATSEEFHKAISEEKEKNPDGFMVDVHNQSDYDNDICFLTEDGKSGIAVTPVGDIISVFSSVKGDHRLDKLMFMAIAAGGKKLDCYYTDKDSHSLARLYSRFGFRTASVVPFNKEYAEWYDEWKNNHTNINILGIAAMYLEQSSPLDTYDLERSPQTETAPSFEDYNEALGKRDSIIDSIDEARQKSMQELQKEQTEGQKKEINKNQEFIDKNVALSTSIDNLLTSKVLTTTEVNEVASQMVNWISDQLTDIQNGKEETLDKYRDALKDLDLKTASRIDIARAIGPIKLVKDCKEAFLSSQTSGVSFKTALKLQVINNNWDALIYLAKSTFMENERFSIINNGTIIEAKEEDNADNFNDSKDPDDIKEDQGSTQENWQIEARTRDIIQHATASVRDALRQCYITDENDNIVKTEFGINRRVPVHEAVESICRWTQGAQDIDDMIDMLEAKVDSNPWINKIIERLKDRSGKEADFQSQFFVSFCLRDQYYSVVKAVKGADGKVTFRSMIVNKSPALKEIFKSIVNQFKIGEHPLFTSKGVNRSALKQLTEALNDLSHAENKETIDSVLTFVYHTLGYYANKKDIADITKDDKTVKKLINSLGYIIKKLTDHIDDSNYQPFTFNRNQEAGSIYGDIRNMLKPLTDRLEDTAISSFYEDGKMYQTHTLPSYLTNLFAKFHQKDKTKFEEFIMKQYGSSEWFKEQTGDISTGWRTPWLDRMINDESGEARGIFEHKVQLTFNKQAYMTELGDLQYLLSILTEYSCEGSDNISWYRVPMLSNKTSSEFIKFYKYTGSKYKDSITLGMIDIMLQEIARIRTVKIRNLKKGDKGFIKNWDTEGISFNLLSFLNQYLTPEGKRTEFGKLLEQATSKEGLSDKDTATLIVKAKEIIKKEMQKKVNSIMEKFEADGIVEAASNIQNFGNSKEEILNNLENFIWNDTFAAMNILELTITDPAYYDGAVDLQKRFAQIHAPGSRPNIKATDYKGNRVADRYSRTFVVNDFKGVISNIVENLTIVFDRKIEAATSAVEREMYKNMKEKIIKQFKDINVTDAQAYNCPTSYRKKAILFGRWSPKKEEIYQKLLKGDYNFSDLEVAFGEVLKPFVYTQTTESVGMENSPIQSIPVPFQNKNSEYLLIMADALLKGENTGRPNLLRVIYEVMEKSAEDNPTRGIDTVQFDSAVKSGLHDAISIHQFIDMPNISDAREKERLAKEHILNSIYEGDPTDHTKRTTKYKSSVRLIDWMDYGIQQEVPQHFNNHEQAHGSQIRAITPSELGEDAKFNVEGRFLSAKEFAKEYEDTIAENIRESLQELEKKFNIQGTRKERNIALAKILQEELESNPRYGIDLKQACLLDKDGEFNMPLGDPIQAKRIEQLINSIIKNTVNKQTIAGGPVVQVSNFGTSKELNIRFKNKNSKSKEDELLLTRDEWESNPIGESYEQYIKDNQGGIAYLEVYAPIYSNELFQRFTKPDGTIDIEVIEKLDPDLLKMVGYRIPTEDKYSCAPLKIVGFLPREASDGIMLPYEITLLSGSDFDVDKIYIMRKDCNIRTDLNKIRKALFDKLKNSQNGKLSEGLRKSLKDLIDQFMLDPYRKESLVNQTTAKGYISIPESAYNILLEVYEELLRSPEYLTVEWPKEGRTYRNNKIVDMTYEVLTHEDSADKLLNPGGFDQQKKLGYMVAAMKRMGGLAMSPDELMDIWERLESMDINELNSLSSSDMNLAFIDTHVQFYKQNSAAAALIGIFAVHKVAHAIIERDPIYINFASASKLDVPMSIGGTVLATIKEDNALKQLTKIDPRTDSSGALIGKTLGSLVASAADAAKDPVLNLMNINKDTANTLNMAIRLGIPFDDAALLLSQKCMSDILDKLNKGRLKNIPTSLKSVIKDRIDEIKKNLGMTKKGAANKVLEEGISKQELIMGLVSSDIKLELKALSYIQALLNINNELKEVTLATRFNSISSAVGPLIVDNLIVENQMKKFSKYIYVFNDTAKNYIKIESIHDILNMHPILQGFSRGYVEARRIMQDMPLYSLDFANIMNAVESFGNPSIIENRSNLSKFADFYNSYLLVANGVIDPGDCSYYVTEFPKEFFFKKNFKERFEGNPFVDAMKLDIDPRTGIASIKIDITGLDNDQKSILMSGYIDLLNKDKELAIDLFKYNFFTGGLGFTPKTFMSLTPLLLKQAIDGYKECFSSRVSSDPRDVIDLFIRNNWSNNDFVKFLPPTSKKKDKKTHQTKEVPNFAINSEGTSITISNNWGLYSRYATQGYIRTVINNKEKLFKRAYDDDDSGILIYVEVKPLGGKNSYLEFTNDPISVSDNISGEDNDNGIRKNPTKEGVVASEEPQPSLDTPSISDVRRAIAAVGLSEDAVTEKLDSFKRNSTEEKQSLKPAIIGFLAKQYTKLNIPFDGDKLNKDFEKMC